MSHLLIFKAEIKRAFLFILRYPFETIATILMAYITFMGIYFCFQATGIFETSVQSKSGLIMGYLMWQTYACGAINNMPSEIMGESQTGILEQVYISSVNPVCFLSAQAFSMFLVDTMWVILLLFGISITTGVFLHMPLFSTIVVFSLTLIGLYGLGFALAGLTLIFKRLGPIVDILNWIFLFFTGVLIPLEKFPSLIQSVAKFLPLTDGVKILQMIIIKDKNILSLINSGDLMELFINSAVYFSIGIMVFRYCDKVARKKGIIGHY